MVEKDPTPGESNPERVPDEEKDEEAKKESPDENVTIKSLLINPLSFSIIELTIKLLRTIEWILPERGDAGTIIKSLLIVANSQHGPPVLEHLLEYGSYTYREIQLKLGVSKSTIHYITNKLLYLKLVEPRSVVIPLNTKSPGPRPIVWVLEGAPPSFSVDCIKRYYGLLSPVRVNGSEYQTESEENLRRILSHIQSYLDRHNWMTIDSLDGKIFSDLVKESGVKGVNLQTLRKELSYLSKSASEEV